MPGVCALKAGLQIQPECVINFGHRAASTPMRVIPAEQAGLARRARAGIQ
jgi:hypothetical protein